MIRIRDGNPSDLPRLRRIQSTALAEASPELLETAVHGTLDLYVITDDAPMGYAIVIAGTGSVAELPELAITPGRQGEGLGSWLLSRICSDLAEAGYDQLRLVIRAADDRVREFYAAHEFSMRERLPDHFESGDGLRLVRPLD